MAEINKTIETELVTRIFNRDAKAFEQLYDLVSPSIYGFVLNLLKRTDLAEDCLHDTFLKVWNNINSFDPEKSGLTTWISVIARNTALDMLKSKHQKNIQSYENTVQSNEASAEMNINHIGLGDLVNKLNPDYYQVIREIYYNDLTHEEAAKKLNIPLGTLKTRVRNALQELKTIFNYS